MTKGTAQLTVRLRDLASPQFKRLGSEGAKSLRKLGDEGKRAGRKLNLAFGRDLSVAAMGLVSFGRSAAAAIGAPLKGAADLEAQIQRTASIAGGGFRQFEQAALKMGASTEHTALDSARALEQLAMGGLSVDESIQALPTTLALATTAAVDLGMAADITTDVLGAFSLGVGDTDRVADVMAATFTNSTNTITDLYEAFKLAGPISKQAGISFEKTAVLAGVLGNAGLKGSLGGTALRGALLALTNTTPKAAKALRKLHLGPKFIEENLKDPLTIIKGLHAEMKDMSGTERLDILGQIFGRRQSGAVGILIDAMDTGAENLAQLTAAVENSAGVNRRIQREMLKTTSGQMKLLGSQFDALKIKMGKALTPSLLKAMRSTGELLSDLDAFARDSPKTVTGLKNAALGLSGLAVSGLALAGVVWVWGATAGGLAAIGAALSGGFIVTGVRLLATGLAAAGVSLSALAPLAVAAAAGVGALAGAGLDRIVGWLFELRDGKLSSWLSDLMGEWEPLNRAVERTGILLQTISDVLKQLGLDRLSDLAGEGGAGLREVADGNRAAKRDRKRFDAGGQQSFDDFEASLSEVQPLTPLEASRVSYGVLAPGSAVGARSAPGVRAQDTARLDVHVTAHSDGRPPTVAVESQSSGLNLGQVAATP